jgi:hypothetical protein
VNAVVSTDVVVSTDAVVSIGVVEAEARRRLERTVAAPVLEGPLSRWKPLELCRRSRAPSRAPRELPRRVVSTCTWRVPMQGWRPPVLVASAGHLLPGPLFTSAACSRRTTSAACSRRTKVLTERISVLAWKAKCNGWVAIENACVSCARASHVRSWSTCTDHGDSRGLAPRLYRQTVGQRRIGRSRYNR